MRDLPKSAAYFFTHYSLFSAALRRHPQILWRRTLVFFTHPSHEPADTRRVIRRLRRAGAVLSMSSIHAARLIADGLPPAQVKVLIPGSDPSRFAGHARGGGFVGFCSAYYRRKDPDRLAGIVAAMPHRRFLLVGRGWREWSGFDRLVAQPNFAYLEPEYADYPGHYARMDVFVSPGRLEGGPMPLLEAMMANVVPVATRTGFAPDLIIPGENGFLFEVDAPLERVCDLVDQAYQLQADIRATVVHRTWDRFVAELQALSAPSTPNAGISSS